MDFQIEQIRLPLAKISNQREEKKTSSSMENCFSFFFYIR